MKKLIENDRGQSSPLVVYLGGKIRANDWRTGIVSPDIDLGDECHHTGNGPWPTLERAIFGEHHYCGPYFVGCDHRCYHGPGSHGVGVTASGCAGASDYHNTPRLTLRRCFAAIDRCDLVFAWIDSPDAYGTLVELGYAAAQGKPVLIAGPERYSDLWFGYTAADGHLFSDWLPPDVAFRAMLQARPVGASL